MCGGVDTGFDSEYAARQHKVKEMIMDLDIGGDEWENYPLDSRKTMMDMVNESPLFVFLDSREPEHIKEFHSMCVSYSHDYGIRSFEDRARIQIMLAPVFNHHVLPLLRKLKEK